MFSLPHLPAAQWVLLGLSAFLTGSSKAGLTGINITLIPLAALAFGGKSSTGYLLPILIFSDVYACFHYRKSVLWPELKKLLIWGILGVFLGTWIGNEISSRAFTRVIGLVILFCSFLLLYREFGVRTPDLSRHRNSLLVFCGLLGGMTSMLGNSAGPIIAFYLLTLNISKPDYLGTSAFFYFILNLIKLFIHLFIWKTINREIIFLGVTQLPILLIGLLLSIRLVKKIPEKGFRLLLTGIALITGIESIFLM